MLCCVTGKSDSVFQVEGVDVCSVKLTMSLALTPAIESSEVAS